MRDIYRSLLTALAVILALWLVLGFWPLSVASRVFLSLVVILAGGGMLWRQWHVARAHRDWLDMPVDTALPPEGFQGAVVLVVGDSDPLFSPEATYRETRQGWYLRVKDAGQLPLLAQHLVNIRPTLVSQVSVLLAIIPEQHVSADQLIQSLRGWHRGVVQCRTWLSGLPPVWTVCWVSASGMTDSPLWFITTDSRPRGAVYQHGQGTVPLSDWLAERGAGGRFTRLSQVLWLATVTDWFSSVVESLLVKRQGELPPLIPFAQGICLVSVNGGAGNLWQHHLTGLTALPPSVTTTPNELPLPELLLSELPRRRGISRRMQFWRMAGVLGGLFLILAMLASFVNNQRLIRSVGDHLALYHRLTGHPMVSKLQAQDRLRADARLLDDWARRGEPMRYRLGLYQGLRLVPSVEAAINDWSPPPSPPPVIRKVMQGPQTIRLDSMSLFDTGKWQLKSDSTKVLINALVGIKAKPGWLIVVSGHTDNTGDDASNQTLSLKRAESVRNWMQITGDVPESCFAVQGYGEGRPVATNDTPAGRTLNRRVEISLVPQADACQVKGESASPAQGDVLTQKMEK